MWRQRPATNHEGSGADPDRWNWMVTGGLSKDIFCHSEFAGIKMKSANWHVLNIQRFHESSCHFLGLLIYIEACKLLQNMLTSKTDDTDRSLMLFAFLLGTTFEPERVRTNPRILIVLCLPSSELDGATSLPPRVCPWKRIPLGGGKNERRRVHFCHVSADFEW